MNDSDFNHFIGQFVENDRVKCPKCSDSRKKKSVKTLGITVTPEETLYQCFHCGLSGKYKRKEAPWKQKSEPKVRAISIPKETDHDLVNKFLVSRGIDPMKVTEYPVVSGTKYFNAEGELDAVGFVYGEQEAIKWRSLQGKTSPKMARQDGFGV